LQALGGSLSYIIILPGVIDLPNGFVTFFLSMLASAIVAFGMVTNADFFAQSEVYTIIGGLMTGVLFFFLFLVRLILIVLVYS
jgi:hypothetical protein